LEPPAASASSDCCTSTNEWTRYLRLGRDALRLDTPFQLTYHTSAMGRINPEQEKRSLASVYSHMTEGELRKVADDAASLTDEALQALREEIGRREVEIPITISPAGADEVELQELVTIRKFRDLPEALLAKGIIDSAGLECFLADDNIVRTDWFISNAVGGIKLRVKPEDAAAAIEVLEQPIPETFDAEGVGRYQQPRCPKCQSTDVTFEELNKPVAYTSAWLGVPIPLHCKAWTCKSCHHEWEDAGTDAPEA